MSTQILKLKYWFLFGLLVCMACNPEDIPEPSLGTPVFSVSAGQVDITAGEDDFYLFTSFEKDSQNVFEFKASFRKLQPDCGNLCTESLEISIRDAAQRLSNFTEIDSALAAELTYLQSGINSQNLLRYTFNATVEGSGPGSFNFKYQIDNEPEVVGTDLFSITSDRAVSQPINQVSLEVTDTMGCVSYVERILSNQFQDGCSVEITTVTNPINQDSVLLIAEAMGAGFFNYSWNNNTFTDTTYYLVFPQQINIAEVTATSVNSNCTSKARVGILGSGFPGGQGYCRSFLDVELDSIFINDLQLSTVLIEYTAPDGEIYRSNEIEQSPNSFFDITNISEFDKNENGAATKKMQISFNCLLETENGAIMDFTNGTGIISLAYPN